MSNLEAWAITQGYDPDEDYSGGEELAPGFLSPHFKKDEFRCHCCGALHPDGDKPPKKLLDLLEDLRAHFGKPVHVNSGFRCEKHNQACGGATHSQHLKGLASDVWIDGVKPSDVYAYLDKTNPNGGLGSYKTFTHVDVRPSGRARWVG